jgi:hypothetical protein
MKARKFLLKGSKSLGRIPRITKSSDAGNELGGVFELMLDPMCLVLPCLHLSESERGRAMTFFEQ